jgi:hypothetical protein
MGVGVLEMYKEGVVDEEHDELSLVEELLLNGMLLPEEALMLKGKELLSE